MTTMKNKGNSNSTKRPSQKFAVGDSVETSKGEKCYIRFIGKVEGLSTLEMFGVEYIDGTIGDTDGSYNGTQYFRGTQQRCQFIKYNKIRRKTKQYENTYICARNQTTSRHRGNSTPSLSSKQSRAIVTENNVNKRKSMPTQLNEFNASKRYKHVKQSRSQQTSTKFRTHKSSESVSKTAKKSVPSSTATQRKTAAVTVSQSLKRSVQSIKSPPSYNRKPTAVVASRSRKSNDFGHEYKSKKQEKYAIKPSGDGSRDRERRNANILSLTAANLHVDRSKSVGNKQRKLQKQSKTVLRSPTIKEQPQLILMPSMNSYLTLSSSDALHDIHIGHRYELKDGRCGICLYCGTLHYKNDGNQYVGIALEKGEGKHDGEVRGRRYFTCKRNCGVFVSRKTIKKDCGAVQQKIMDSFSSLHNKRPSHCLYDDDDSEISDLSDINDIGCCLSDDDRSHSGHSDVGCSGEQEANDANERISIDSQDTVLSYIDVFSATQWEESDNDVDTDEKKHVVPNHQQQRHQKISSKPKMIKKHLHSKSAPTNDFELNDLLSPTLAELSALNGVCKRKRTKVKTTTSTEDDDQTSQRRVLVPRLTAPTLLKSSSHMITPSPLICESPMEEYNTGNQFIKPAGRKRRNATSIVTVPYQTTERAPHRHKIGATNDFYIDLSSKSLTPLHCNVKK